MRTPALVSDMPISAGLEPSPPFAIDGKWAKSSKTGSWSGVSTANLTASTYFLLGVVRIWNKNMGMVVSDHLLWRYE